MREIHAEGSSRRQEGTLSEDREPRGREAGYHVEVAKEPPTLNPRADACQTQISLPGRIGSSAEVHEFADLGQSSGVLREFLHFLRRAPGGVHDVAQAQALSLASMMRTQLRVFGSLAFKIAGHRERIEDRTSARERLYVHELIRTRAESVGRGTEFPAHITWDVRASYQMEL